jgi:hypothetical protein
MILLPNEEKEQLIGTENERRFMDRFHLYYKPRAWSNNGSTAPAAGYELANLSAPEYSMYCRWNANTVTIAGSFGAPVEIDTLILGDTNADKIRGGFYNGNTLAHDITHDFWYTKGRHHIKANTGSRIIFKTGDNNGKDIKRRLAPGEHTLDITDQNIVIFPLTPEPIMVTRFSITLAGSSPVSLHKLHIGLDTGIALPSALSYPFEGGGEGKISDIGIVYGTKWPSRRTLEAEWDLLEDADRRTLERYIDAAQNVDPHFILPIAEDYYIPPIYGVLGNQQLGNAKRQTSWHWGKQKLAWTRVN